MFNLLPIPDTCYTSLEEQDPVYQIEEVYDIPLTGCVVGGILQQGQLHLPTNGSIDCLVGPDRGVFTPAVVTSIQRQRLAVRNVKAGQAATIALQFPNELQPEKLQTHPPAGFRLRRGQVIIEAGTQPRAQIEFTADIHVLSHPNAMAVGLQGTVHCGSLRQQVKVMSTEALVPGNVGRVKFKFMNEAEYVVGQSIMFHGPQKVKCVGIIVKDI